MTLNGKELFEKLSIVVFESYYGYIREGGSFFSLYYNMFSVIFNFLFVFREGRLRGFSVRL